MLNALRVGWFLAWRQLRRSNPWTTLLIIFIMTLTFFNLVVVGGVLVGLIEGSSVAYREQYSGDLLVDNLPTKDHIEESRRLITTARALPAVQHVSGRYITSGTIEANYKDGRKLNEKPDEVGIQIAGINPDDEQAVTKLFDRLVDGDPLQQGDTGFIVIGRGNLEEYNRGIPGLDTISGVEVGSDVLVKIGEIEREYKVKGILQSKIEAVDFRAFILDSELRSLLGRTDFQMDEIAMTIDPGVAPETVQAQLWAAGFDRYALVQTWEESQGTFFRDIKTTFGMLGSIIGAIGLLVASITVFIVIFINAVTRQRFIGILKALGVQGQAVVIAYVIQSIFYGVVGSVIGFAIVYGFLEPYIRQNPIDFPFSDGILAAPLGSTLIRFVLLMVATIIAGYIPAKMITRRPALRSLLGR